MPIMLNKTATQSSVAQPQTNAGTQGNTQQTQQPSPTYTFNGQTYTTREAADEARNKYIADRKMKVMSVFADAASVGFDEDQFKALIQSGSGLSQMSDAERSYISSRYQATNPYDRKAYTDSAVDQYLASVGLPSSKELNNYRKAYYEYASGGGVAEKYSNLDDDTFRYIQKHWKDGMQTGIDGKLYTSNGKEVEYKDTLLDEQLQSFGLPPSSMMNDYFLDYRQDKQIDAEIDDFYAAVYEKSNKGMSSEEAYRTTLADPKYLHLSEYVSEAVAYPNEADYTDDDVLSDTCGQTDSAKYDAAWGKALTADAKRDAMEHRISYKDYEGYAAKRMQLARDEARTAKYKEFQENGRKWMTTPATTDDEKKQRSTEMTQFLAVYGNGTTLSDMGTYFSLLDAGVPYETIGEGYAAVAAWNEKHNTSDTYADVKLLSQGYSMDDGDYAANREIVKQTKLYSGHQLYEEHKDFDVALYDAQAYHSGKGRHSWKVSPEGAIYAAVNGYKHAEPDFSESVDLYSLYAFANTEDSNGKRMSDYMTETEKGVFNYLFSKNIGRSMEYLNGLYGMIEDRQYAAREGSFAMRLAMDGVNVSEGEVASYVYDSLVYQQGQALEEIPEGRSDAWHLEAWCKYAGYSDEKLQEIADTWDEQVDKSPSGMPYPSIYGMGFTPAASSSETTMRALYSVIGASNKDNPARWVLDTRKKLREEANVTASLFEYTEDEGEAATAEHDYLARIEKSTPPSSSYVPNAETLPFGDYLQWSIDGGREDESLKPLIAQMTPTQRNQYNWLYKNKGRETAQAYFNVIRPYLDEAAENKVVSETKAFAKDHPVLVSLASIPGTIASGIEGLLGTALNLSSGTELTRTDAATWSANSIMREGVAEDMSPAGAFFYQTGMSMADSAVAMLFSAGGGDVGTIMLGASAYTSTLHAAVDRGLDSKSAYMTALVAGVAEYATEKVGLETLMEGIKGLGKSAGKTVTREFLFNIAKQMLYEGSEEVASDVINFVYDNIFNGDMSEFAQNVDHLIDAGYTKEEAQRIAWKNQIVSTSLSFAGGALSGGVMSGVGGGAKLAFHGLSNYAFGNGTAQQSTPAPVRKHTDTYTAGRSVVDRMFGKSVGDNVQLALENRESESDAQRIDAISNALLNLDNSSYLYGYTHDADGNLTLSDDERVALASVLAMAYDDANADNLDAAFIHAMSQMQTDQQRAANTNYDGIKTAQEIRNINEQIAKTQESINTIETEQQVKLSDAQSTYSAAASEVHAITKKIAAVTSAKEKKSLQASLKVAQDKRDNIKARLKTIETTDAANTQARIKAAKEEIARQRSLLDRHYASASAFLNEYAPTSFSGATAARAASNARASDVGAKIDAIVSSDMSESEKESALAPLREQLASAVGNVRSIENRLNNADPAALSNAMNAMKSGTVSDFIRSQQENAQNASNSAQNAETENTSNTEQNGEDAASNGVKQSDAKQNTEKKTEHVIGARVQQQFNRIARKFGCEITWGDDNTVIGDSGLTLKGRNGAYNRSEPNKIYLNTRMFTKNALSSEQAVAREFFTHEIIHYVANTKTFRSIMARAASYYNTTYKDKGGTDYLVNAIIADEQMRGNTGFGRAQALEEMTAQFAQEVLFAKTNGDRRALVWLARSDRGIVSNFLTTVEYLIKRGNVRRSKDGGAMKAMLLDTEYELIQALRERQYLDARGKTSAFERRSTRASVNAEAFDGAEAGSEAEPSVASSRQGMDADEYLKGLRRDYGYRIRKDVSFDQQIDEWNREQNNGVKFYLGNLVRPYNEVGADYAQVFLDSHKLLKVQNEHPEMTDDVIKQIPKLLKSPVLLLESKTVPGRIMALGDVYSDGLPVFAIIEPNAKAKGESVHAALLVNAYTKQSYSSDKMAHTQDIINKSRILWVNPKEERIRAWKNTTRLLLPSSAKPGFNARLSQSEQSVNPQNLGAETETLSDVRAIFTGKGEGHGDVRNSRGMTTDEYMTLDFSKNKLLQNDGTPYDELYSGTPFAGFTIFDPAYADDGLSNFATSSRRIAQSYTWAGEKAGEYDPQNADRHRNQTGAKGEYLQVNEYGQYRRHDDSQLLNMLNQQSGYAFDVVNMQEADLELRSIKKGPVKADAAEGMNIAKLIYYAASHVATNHTAADFEELQDAYGALKIMNERLAPAARTELERVRGRISDADYKVGAETPENTPLLAVTSYLRALQTGVEDTLINSGIYDTLQSADEHMSRYWDMETGELLQANVPEDLFVGFDSKYKGKAQLYDRWETETRLPTYSGGENGVYKLKLYAEHPLSIDVQDQNWDSIDVNSFPADVREKLAQLYGYKLSYITREVSRAAYEAGYDAVVFRGLHDTGSFDMDEASDVIITFKPYQSKSVYNENPTTNPDIMFSTGMTIDDYINRYGQKEQNIFGQQNNIRTPNNVDNDAGHVFRVSDSAQTLKEVAHIRQSARDVIDEGILQQADGLIERHGLVYETITLDRMRELGTRYIAEHGGLTQSMRDLTRDMPRASQGQLVEYMSAANQVFTEIGAEGTFDPREYYEFVASYVEMRSTWGRVGRAMQLVNDSPLGRVAYWQRVITRINEKNNEAVRRGLNPLFYRNGAPVIDVPQSFFDVLAQARTQEEIDAAELAITRYIGQNSPLTVSDALRNWRYFSMLANPVTHARNMLGNVTMLGGRTVKDTIAAGMENVAVRMGLMDADERTHAVVLSQDADTRAYVRQLWDENADAVQSGGRDGFKQQLSDAVRKSPIRALDAAMRFNGNALETEDRLFLYSTFTAAASQYIKAQNLDVNHITREQQGAIVNYATQQAQEATYRDASKLADALNQFAKSGWVQQLIVDAVMPFKKTPINIAKRGLEYSPAGFAKGLYHIAQNAVAQHRGEQPHVRASVIVDELAKGVTGSMLSLIGFFLAKAGILKVSAGDGDKDSAFERDVGHQDYSLEIGGVSIKIESLAPLTFPLFMGAQLQRLTSEEHDGLSMSDLTDAAMTLADPLMDMSFMSSLNSVLETYDNNKLSGVAVNAMQAYLGQYLPTLGSKLNQTINPTRRTAKASQASPLGTTWDYWLRSMAAKIPGVNQAVLEPYVKTTGEYDKKTSFGDYALAFINNFVSPVNVQIMDTSSVNTELARIVSVTGATDFVPQNPKKYLTIGGERYNMTAKEYTQYSKEHNETVYAVLSQVIQSDAYARATDDQRAEMLKKAYDRAHKTIMDKYKAIFAQK